MVQRQLVRLSVQSESIPVRARNLDAKDPKQVRLRNLEDFATELWIGALGIPNRSSRESD